jgi:hypothetical protein
MFYKMCDCKEIQNKSVFFSCDSTDGNNSNFIKEKLTELLAKDNINICDPDIQSGHLSSIIFEQIDNCNLFVVDISPLIIQDVLSMNKNVMLELGYALAKKNIVDIILICQESKIKDIPSMLKGYHYELLYEPIDDSVNQLHDLILDRIREPLKLSTIILPNVIDKYLANLCRVKNIVYMIERKHNELFLYMLTQYKLKGIINIRKQSVHTIHSKYEDLSDLNDIKNYLQHLEILCTTNLVNFESVTKEVYDELKKYRCESCNLIKKHSTTDKTILSQVD